MDVDATLAVLERQPANGRAFEKLNDWIDEAVESGADTTAYDERIVRVCLAAIEGHYTKRRLCDTMKISASNCIAACVDDQNVVLITASEYFLRFVFDGFGNVEAYQDRHPDDIAYWYSLDVALIGVLEVVGFVAGPAYRTTVVIRYYTRLQRIFCYTNPITLGFIVRRPEYYGIVVTTPSIMDVLIEKTNYRNYLAEENERARVVIECYCTAALFLMGTAESLDDASRLQELLGFGLLNVAGVLKSSESDKEAGMFRRILAKYPAWRRHFVALTEGGVGAVAAVRDEIARSLRRASAGVHYIFCNPDIVDF